MANKYGDEWGGEGDATGRTQDNEGRLGGGENRQTGARTEERIGVGRRPMNAFLIFCKRQRSAVRRRYPNLENRAVTRVLGEWWASLSTVEKESYIRLASQYKEAYMKAHPEFRWNRMPAVTTSSSPTRLVATRTKPTRLTNPQFSLDTTQGQIVPGKLADESQLGGLSSLLAKPAHTGLSQVPKPPKKRYLEENYTEKDKNNLINGDISNGGTEEEEEEGKGLSNEKEGVRGREKENKEAEAARMRIWRRTLLSSKGEEEDEDEEEEEEEEEEEGEVNNNKEAMEEEGGGRRRRARACKGRRYKEFMWSNLATRRRHRWEMAQELGDSHGNKRKLRDRRDEDGERKKVKEEAVNRRAVREATKNLRMKEEGGGIKTAKETARVKEEFVTGPVPYMDQVIAATQEIGVAEIKEETNQNGFNLEERIDALPPLSIEEFHNRKRSRKGMKVTLPINTMRSKVRRDVEEGGPREECLNNNITTVVDNNNQNLVFCGPQCATVTAGTCKEEEKAVIGSRKRKLRRQGIRRLEPGSTFKGTSVVEVASPDIIGLATLADVAAKKPRLISK